jgi:hypothetical protein
MRTAVILLLAMASAVPASQIVHMDLDDVVSWAGTILLARVESVEDAGCQDTRVAIFEIDVLEIIEGSADSSATISCSYAQFMPETYYDDDGNEITEWPLVTGSGIEMQVAPGDTVVVLLRSQMVMPGTMQSVIRMEPSDSLESIVNLILETAGPLQAD